MPEDQTTTMPAQTPDKHLSPVQKRRVSAKVRQALTLRVYDALPWDECARRAGLSPAAIYKARKQPHVIATFEDMQAQYLQEVERQRGPLKALALQHARDLLTNAKSESVKARMVEFLAGEPKGNSVNVAVNVQNNVGNGYEYVRPGQKLVDITPALDTQSGNEDDETPMK